MFNQDNSLLFYKKVLIWLGYALILIIFVYLLLLTIDLFLEKTFTKKADVYEEFRIQYTADPGDESEVIDRERWKRDTAHKNWSLANFTYGYAHPFVTFTISFIIVTAIIGTIIVFRNFLKNLRK